MSAVDLLPAVSPSPPGPRPDNGGRPSAEAVAVRPSDRLLARVDALCRVDATLRAALLVTPDSPTGELRPRAVWPAGTIPPTAVVQASVQASRAKGVVSVRGPERDDAVARVIAVRVETPDQMLGVVSVLLDGPADEVEASRRRWRTLFDEVRRPAAAATAPPDTAPPATLPVALPLHDVDPDATNAAVAAIGVVAAATASAPIATPAPASHPDDALRHAFACHAALYRAPRFEDGLRAMLEVLARRHGCTRVVCCWSDGARRDGIVVSGTATGRPSRELADAYASAIDEALARDACLAWPDPLVRAPGRLAAQARLAGRAGATAVCAAPMVAHGRAVGGLVLERVGLPFDSDARADVERIAAFVAAPLAVYRRAERPWASLARRLLDASRRARPRDDDPRALGAVSRA